MLRIHSGLMIGIAISLDDLRTDSDTIWSTIGGRIREAGSQALFCDMTGEPYAERTHTEWSEAVQSMAQNMEMGADDFMAMMTCDGDHPTDVPISQRPVRLFPGVARGELASGSNNPEPGDRMVLGVILARLDDYDDDFAAAVDGISIAESYSQSGVVLQMAESLGVPHAEIKLFPWLYVSGMGVPVGIDNEDEHSDTDELHEDQSDDGLDGPHVNCSSCAEHEGCAEWQEWHSDL